MKQHSYNEFPPTETEGIELSTLSTSWNSADGSPGDIYIELPDGYTAISPDTAIDLAHTLLNMAWDTKHYIVEQDKVLEDILPTPATEDPNGGWGTYDDDYEWNSPIVAEKETFTDFEKKRERRWPWVSTINGTSIELRSFILDVLEEWEESKSKNKDETTGKSALEEIRKILGL